MLPVTHLPFASHAEVKVKALAALVPIAHDRLVAAITDDVLVNGFHHLIVILCRQRNFLFCDTNFLSWGDQFRVPLNAINLDLDNVLEEILTVQKHGQVIVVNDGELGSRFI